MKHVHSLIPILFSIVMLASCTESIEQPLRSSTESAIDVKELLTKSIDSKLSTGVTQEDVADYLVYRQKETLEAVKDIVRYDIDEDVHVYIVNMKRGGWYLFSGDCLTTPIIAQGDDGELSLDGDLSTQCRNWLASIAYYTQQQKIESRGVNQWTRQGGYRSEDNPLIPDTSSLSVEYVIDTLVNEYFPPLTITTWDQGAPWNNAMPMKSLGARCLAGCTVIAIGQLLYYTHFAFGYPNDTYTSASCNNFYYEGPPYTFTFTGATTNGWSDMAVDGWGLEYFDTYAPALCALIAERSNTTYGVEHPGEPDEGDSYGSTLPIYIPSTLNSFLLFTLYSPLKQALFK